MCVRLAALAVAWTMVVAASAKTQDFGGKVIDEKGQPIAYVNVVQAGKGLNNDFGDGPRNGQG